MELTDAKRKEYIRRLLMSRMRILTRNGFYGLLLMHMEFALDSSLDTAATDARKIMFAPKFLEELNDSELDFVLMHEVLHCALQHCMRTGDRDSFMFNVACDIVVNSNILKSNGMKAESITLRRYGESMHKTPDGREGYRFTAEEVYEMLKKKGCPNGSGKSPGGVAVSGSMSNRGGSSGGAGWDDHSKWGTDHSDKSSSEVWARRVINACESISVRDPSNEQGLMPMCAQRLLRELRSPQTDWRTVLNDFVQEEVVDYSFAPPDRRFGDSPFFLPDYNDTDISVKNILFMIDTSGSMSDDEVTAAYSEVKGAIDQFNGKLRGWLGFFDAAVVDPVPFEDEGDMLRIKPAGGGGTSFGIVFDYVRDFMSDDLPASIIILTDGYASFPDESVTMGIPVLWILDNEEIDPPWGKVARIKSL
ncbi:Predicted metal-dependent peptidase [Ruminococcaceae bacterium YRB3002]|nr:Predicted metal-dependent peptidase [Ruminococcaceae bacterium YRB3002]